MAKLVILTQVYENYGTATQPHWKPKGGDNYVVSNFTQFNSVQAVVDSIRDRLEIDDEFYNEYIIDWYVAEDSYLTRDERLQLEFEGRITHPAKELVVVA
jgi:hypothetical protein